MLHGGVTASIPVGRLWHHQGRGGRGEISGLSVLSNKQPFAPDEFYRVWQGLYLQQPTVLMYQNKQQVDV